ncbi:hypothetical protein EXIGLDRAFT_692247, partial [Exidia glandulosa HHB12029]
MGTVGGHRNPVKKRQVLKALPGCSANNNFWAKNGATIFTFQNRHPELCAVEALIAPRKLPPGQMQAPAALGRLLLYPHSCPVAGDQAIVCNVRATGCERFRNRTMALLMDEICVGPDASQWNVARMCGATAFWELVEYAHGVVDQREQGGALGAERIMIEFWELFSEESVDSMQEYECEGRGASFKVTRGSNISLDSASLFVISGTIGLAQIWVTSAPSKSHISVRNTTDPARHEPSADRGGGECTSHGGIDQTESSVHGTRLREQSRWVTRTRSKAVRCMWRRDRDAEAGYDASENVQDVARMRAATGEELREGSTFLQSPCRKRNACVKLGEHSTIIPLKGLVSRDSAHGVGAEWEVKLMVLRGYSLPKSLPTATKNGQRRPKWLRLYQDLENGSSKKTKNIDKVAGCDRPWQTVISCALGDLGNDLLHQRLVLHRLAHL